MRERLKHVNVWGGVIVPVPLAVYAVWCLATQKSVIVGDGFDADTGILYVRGAVAIAMGICYLGIAVALHSSFVWGRLDRTWMLGWAGFIVGVVTAICSFVYVLYCFAIGWGQFVPG